ncbi:terminase small subunit [uncultured Akkermansia sp.]|jgi:hypothetical protein|uniref:terminase small subunit n=1 Tax=uncultured Akkermansia sp. TaxID=512294 RepID=UPI0025F98323|nr:terminase small subunit [uncultured Akkermansia sp.]
MREQKMTEKAKEFARCYFECRNGTKAYRESYGKDKELKDASCATESSKLLKNPKVQEYLKELNEKAESEAILKRRKRMIYLSRVVTTPLGKVDENSDLCQEFVTNEFGTRCRMPDKLKAIQELNKMDGGYAPEEVKISSELSFGVLLKGLKSTPLVQSHTGPKDFKGDVSFDDVEDK